jgi:hypothetical protein
LARVLGSERLRYEYDPASGIRRERACERSSSKLYGPQSPDWKAIKCKYQAMRDVFLVWGSYRGFGVRF